MPDNPSAVGPNPSELEAEVKRLQGEIQSRDEKIKVLQTRVDELSAIVQRLQADRPSLQVESLVSSFVTLLETQQEQATHPTPSGIAATLQAMDVEIKGFVDVQNDKTHIVVPQPGETLDANSLSLFRLSFGTVPTLPPVAPVADQPAPHGGRRRRRSASQSEGKK
jgi:hypothetical protein